MSEYRYHPTPKFRAKLKKIAKANRPGYQRILRVIDRLLKTPEDADGVMHGMHHGRYKKYVGRRDYRLIYHWCESCRRAGKKLARECGLCGQVDDNSVIFVDVYHKNELNNLKHQQ